MPTIEKVHETWTSSSVTTLFDLCSKAEIDTSPPLQSPIAGFGWRLIMSRALPMYKGFCNRQSRCHIFFSSRDCPSAWCGAPIKVTVSFPSRPHGHAKEPPQSFCTSSFLGDKRLLFTHSIEELGDALVSLEVAFSNLQTRNLFDVLACAGLTQDAPAKEGSDVVPQARTALRTLEQSLKTGAPFDIIFQAYARRLFPGNVTKPIPVYASTAVLHATVLLPDFSEEDLDASSLFELVSEGDHPPFTSGDYEYESDSDLDDGEGDHLTAVQPTEELPTGGEASPRYDQEYITDSGSISSFSSLEAVFQEQPNIRTQPLEEAGIILNQNVKSGSRVVLVKGVAWKTWHAFIYYCYTGVINFSNLRSQVTTETTLQSPSKDGPPHCSPKSMYRLARKLQINALSQLALNAIEARLSPANILHEAFSRFTARRDAVREMEMALLVKHRSAPDVLQGLSAKMEAVAIGDIPHAGPILADLYQRITQAANN